MDLKPNKTINSTFVSTVVRYMDFILDNGASSNNTKRMKVVVLVRYML
jgi:hypothetical protein